MYIFNLFHVCLCVPHPPPSASTPFSLCYCLCMCSHVIYVYCFCMFSRVAAWITSVFRLVIYSRTSETVLVFLSCGPSAVNCPRLLVYYCLSCCVRPSAVSLWDSARCPCYFVLAFSPDLYGFSLNLLISRPSAEILDCTVYLLSDLLWTFLNTTQLVVYAIINPEITPKLQQRCITWRNKNLKWIENLHKCIRVYPTPCF